MLWFDRSLHRTPRPLPRLASFVCLMVETRMNMLPLLLLGVTKLQFPAEPNYPMALAVTIPSLPKLLGSETVD